MNSVKSSKFARVSSAFFVGLLLTTLSLQASIVRASADTANLAPGARVSLTFDDGLTSALTQAAPTLAQYGLVGTDYVITGCVGTKNTCPANQSANYMTWAQVAKLQSSYGWEIGSHTVDHPLMSKLTAVQQDQELADSKAAFTAHGIDATDFATPYGDYNHTTLTEIAKYYASHRGFFDYGYNNWPYNDYLLRDQQVQGGVSVAQVKQYIDTAIANNTWLVLVFHDIKPKASTKPSDYQYSTANLGKIAAYIKSKQDSGLIQSSRIDQGLVTGGTNLLPNSSFNDGISDGWTTPNSAAVTADSGTNGSYPDPLHSVKFTAQSSATRLYSPRIAVDPYTTYALKTFVNVAERSGGDIEFYVDEYDARGNWISGQYKGASSYLFAGDFSFGYTPSSTRVVTADLQITVTGGSGITAYLDNAQWMAVSRVTPPVQTNLVANGTFDAGISDGWSTDDPANITADSAGNGSPNNAANSVKLIASTGSSNTHLFSPLVAVDSTQSYTITSWLNVRAIASGEVGFYVDEYDANGNWISGQYKTGVRAVSTGDVSLAYTPTSANVAKASLQIIVVGNSGITAYFDDVRWYQN